MDLHSDQTFSVDQFGIQPSFPMLQGDAKCDVLILGGGISGSLMAHYLVKNGLQCLLVDKREIGMGSTSASTSLLLYELDDPIIKLSKKIGLQKADRVLKAGVDAVYKLEEIAKDIGLLQFEKRKSLYFSGSPEDKEMLGQEFSIRKQLGFDVSFLESSELEKIYGLVADAAILSECGAQTDAYMFTHSLHRFNEKNMCGIFSNTKVVDLDFKSNGIIATTGEGYTISAKYIVHATGYESQEYLPEKVVNLRSTFVTSAKLPEYAKHFCSEAIYWNSADPYLYMRCAGNSILVGGEDEDFYDPKLRDSLLPGKERILEASFNQLFPNIAFKADFSWCGTFGTTNDGLPFIGSYGDPRNFFLLGFGGNGIVFSQIAAEILSNAIRGRPHALKNHFAFDR